MIAIARKRKQNSAYTTQGEARPGIPDTGLDLLAGTQSEADISRAARLEPSRGLCM